MASSANRSWFKKLLKLSVKALLFFAAFSVVLVAILRFINPPVWAWRIERHFFPPAPITQVRHQWVSIDSISSAMQLSVIAAEDQHFPEHYGFDMDAIKAAINYNERGRKIRGASTLSQQTAKNLFMWSSRSFVRKGFEAWFTALMELGWPKARILEVYLNIVEFGPGIYGVEAAAKHYFGVSASQLTTYQASLLAAALPNPWRYKVNPASPYVSERAAWIRKQMRQLGQVTLDAVYE